MRRIFTYLLAVIVMPLLAVSCYDDDFERDLPVHYSQYSHVRAASPQTRRVVLLYSIGYNTISSYLAEDIKELGESYLPGPSRNDDVLLVMSYQPEKSGNYTTPTEPVLVRMFKDYDGTAVRDTVLRWSAGTICSDGEFTSDLLGYIKEEYPAAGYGMVFSSHATGWLPECYTVSRSMGPSRSIGNEKHGNTYYEMDLTEFAAAFPMKFDYILFDACLMGGVEVAYELRDVCDNIGFSQTEILADGFNYRTLTETLIPRSRPGDPEKVCRDYFAQYEKGGGTNGATISYIDCTRLEPLAEVCSRLFDSVRPALNVLDGDLVQGFYQYGWQWFYDLRDIAVKA
ncbi:MAG: clostripain-related cysteine peptidase, partial [Bacteroidales bacterium]|nr:clostripain-related cysteine peptidase [Bacteroidales bacterium]